MGRPPVSYKSAKRNARKNRIWTAQDRRNKASGALVGRSTIWQQDKLAALGIPRSKSVGWTASRADKEIQKRTPKQPVPYDCAPRPKTPENVRLMLEGDARCRMNDYGVDFGTGLAIATAEYRTFERLAAARKAGKPGASGQAGPDQH